jgi:hypothetical protein
VISVQAAGVGNWDEIVRVGDWDVGRRPSLALAVSAPECHDFTRHLGERDNEEDRVPRRRDAAILTPSR